VAGALMAEESNGVGESPSASFLGHSSILGGSPHARHLNERDDHYSPDMWQADSSHALGVAMHSFTTRARLKILKPRSRWERLVASCEKPWFQSWVGLIILCNSAVIGLETDLPHFPYWPLVENAFLLVFTIELGIRLAHFGLWGLVTHDDWVWNTLDLAIVGSGIIDMWVLTLVCYLSGVQQRHNKLLTLMRMTRLLRLMRLLRQLKQVQQLYDLSIALLQATEALGWMLILFACFMYAVSIMCTHLIGHSLGIPSDTLKLLYEEVETQKSEAAGLQERRLKGGNANGVAAGIDVVQSQFSSVPQSMYTLFQVVAGWVLTPFEDLLGRLPWLKLAFIIFWIFTSWALLSVMTGTVSEGMVHQKDLQNSAARAARMSRVNQFKLGLLRHSHSMKLTREKVEQIFEDQVMGAATEERDALVEELADMSDVFDMVAAGRKVIPLKDFAFALSSASSDLSSRTVMRAEAAHWKARNSLRHKVEAVATTTTQLTQDLDRAASVLGIAIPNQ